MSHTSVENYLHIIFATKNREPLILPDFEKRLYGYINGIAIKKQSPILNINGIEDHIHLLIKLHPSVPLSTMVKELKSYSSGWMKKEGDPNFKWQEGYGGFSYGKSQLPALMKYIENQKNHHKVKTFDDELALIKLKWGVSWHTD
jgi:putative transposase